MSWHSKTDRFPVQEFIVTPKSPNAIPVADRLGRDVVVQAALDPAITSIEYMHALRVGAGSYPFDGIVMVRDGARYAVELGCATPTVRSLDEEGLRLLAFDTLDAVPGIALRRDIAREPRCSNARLVWECAGHHVRLQRRLEILDLLDCRGAMHVGGFGGPREDVFALACDAVVDIDLDAADIATAEVRRSIGPTAPRPCSLGGIRA